MCYAQSVERVLLFLFIYMLVRCVSRCVRCALFCKNFCVQEARSISEAFEKNLSDMRTARRVLAARDKVLQVRVQCVFVVHNVSSDILNFFSFVFFCICQHYSELFLDEMKNPEVPHPYIGDEDEEDVAFCALLTIAEEKQPPNAPLVEVEPGESSASCDHLSPSESSVPGEGIQLKKKRKNRK